MTDKQRWSDEFPTTWEENHSLLFSEGVLERLPEGESKTPSSGWFGKDVLGDLGKSMMDIPYLLLASEAKEVERVFLWEDHVAHLLRRDIPGQGVFLTTASTHQRERYKALMAQRAFRFV